MNLKKSDILQVNVTAIAGIMILLTISSVQSDNSILHSGGILRFLAWVMIVPFAISSFVVIRGEIDMIKKLQINKLDEIKQTVSIQKGLFWMLGGFAYIVVFLGAYSILSLV